MSFFGPFLLPFVLISVFWVAVRLQGRLADHHRSRETVEAIRLVLSMLVTFSAIVLGLLTTSAKAHFDAFRTDLQTYAVDLIAADQRLREFGPAASATRTELRAYTAAAVADTWPDEERPPGAYPLHPQGFAPGSAESTQLGGMLLQIDRMVSDLPTDTTEDRILAAALTARMTEMLEHRFLLVSAAQPTVTGWFLAVMTGWLSLLFAVFGLSVPGNRVVYAVIAAMALSLSGAMWLIVEMDTPLTGIIRVSSEPLRDALQHMDAVLE